MKQKSLSVILALVLTLSLGIGSSYAAESAGTNETGSTKNSGSSVFSDISGHWAESIIEEAASLKILGGYPDGTFKPDNLIKREEFFKLLTNIMTEKPDTANTKIQFKDVVADEWYVPTIKIAVASGITSGYGDGRFGIGLMISRQEAAKVAGSVITSDDTDAAKGVSTAKDKASIADWAYKYVDLMFQKGYMKGDTEGNFRPTMALTRAEAATILLNVKKNEKVIAANADELALAGCANIHAVSGGAFTKGDGTRKDPYQISNEAQLNHLRMHTSEGAFYILTKNIAITKDYVTAAPASTSNEADWSEGNFQPIGSKEVPFAGTLDGDGYTISGLNIIGKTGKGDDKSAANYTGLFGYLASGASISDLTIDASNVKGNQYTGAVAGYSEGSVKDCKLGKKGIVEGSSYTGGLVGYSTKPLDSLKNLGSVTGTLSNTGGIAGYLIADGTAAQSCSNEGSVKGKEKTGGIVGTVISTANGDSSIESCDNSGAVDGGSGNAGGIAGMVSGGNNVATIKKCANSGDVTGGGVIGGIAGFSDSSKSVVIDCQNTGTVDGNSSGGIVGNNKGKISYCYNSGSVKGILAGGGIVSYQKDKEGSITKCYNEGKVNARNATGGIAGENGSYIDNCYNSGRISGEGFTGGITGWNSGTFTNVYGAGTVQDDDTEGSLAGRNSGYITNAFWLDSSCATGVGLEDNVSHQQAVKKVTHEELSGQKKLSTTNGFVMLMNVMNQNNATSQDKINKTTPEPVWEYLYKISVPAPGNSTVVSDGGNIVPALEMPNLDSTGNTIDSADLQNKYLYPSIIN